MFNLSRGDTIGVIGLSSPIEPGRLTHGLKILKSLGFNSRVALDPSREYGRMDALFASDSPKERVRGFNELLKDKSVKAILSARGGYSSMEVLPLLDEGLIKSNPKPFIGFSDSTAIISLLAGKIGLPCIHGPSLESAFAKYDSSGAAKESADALSALLLGENKNPFSGLKLGAVLHPGDFSGKILGGNLSVLSSLVGGPCELNFKGSILFLEEVGERPYRIHRALLQLKQARLLKDLAGVLLGTFNNCVHPKGEGPTTEAAIKDIFSEYPYPVYSGLPSGHEEKNLPIPFGVPAEVRGSELKFSI